MERCLPAALLRRMAMACALLFTALGAWADESTATAWGTSDPYVRQGQEIFNLLTSSTTPANREALERMVSSMTAVLNGRMDAAALRALMNDIAAEIRASIDENCAGCSQRARARANVLAALLHAYGRGEVGRARIAEAFAAWQNTDEGRGRSFRDYLDWLAAGDVPLEELVLRQNQRMQPLFMGASLSPASTISLGTGSPIDARVGQPFASSVVQAAQLYPHNATINGQRASVQVLFVGGGNYPGAPAGRPMLQVVLLGSDGRPTGSHNYFLEGSSVTSSSHGYTVRAVRQGNGDYSIQITGRGGAAVPIQGGSSAYELYLRRLAAQPVRQITISSRTYLVSVEGHGYDPHARGNVTQTVGQWSLFESTRVVGGGMTWQQLLEEVRRSSGSLSGLIGRLGLSGLNGLMPDQLAEVVRRSQGEGPLRDVVLRDPRSAIPAGSNTGLGFRRGEDGRYEFRTDIPRPEPPPPPGGSGNGNGNGGNGNGQVPQGWPPLTGYTANMTLFNKLPESMRNRYMFYEKDGQSYILLGQNQPWVPFPLASATGIQNPTSVDIRTGEGGKVYLFAESAQGASYLDLTATLQTAQAPGGEGFVIDGQDRALNRLQITRTSPRVEGNVVTGAIKDRMIMEDFARRLGHDVSRVMAFIDRHRAGNNDIGVNMSSDSILVHLRGDMIPRLQRNTTTGEYTEGTAAAPTDGFRALGGPPPGPGGMTTYVTDQGAMSRTSTATSLGNFEITGAPSGQQYGLVGSQADAQTRNAALFRLVYSTGGPTTIGAFVQYNIRAANGLFRPHPYDLSRVGVTNLAAVSGGLDIGGIVLSGNLDNAINLQVGPPPSIRNNVDFRTRGMIAVYRGGTENSQFLGLIAWWGFEGDNAEARRLAALRYAGLPGG